MDATQCAAFLVGFVTALLGVALVTFSGSRYSPSDSLLLNLVPPTTAWHNMGYWDAGDDFPTACANLARKVAQLAGLEKAGTGDGGGEKGKRVADCGYGNGDSCFLLSEEFGVDTVIGWTIAEDQFDLAQRRLASRPLGGKVDLRLGDATKGLRSLPRSSLDAVLALDTAYHFDRVAFFASALDALKPGSILALTDLCLPPAPLSRTEAIILGLICRISSVPHLMNQRDYGAKLKEAGFEDVHLCDITPQVFHGLLSFLRKQDHELGGVLGRRWAFLNISVGACLRWWIGGEKARLRFLLVSAKKPLS
jgi:SAM-dependent methyltransferase